MNHWQKRKSIFIAMASFIIPALLMLLICMLEGFYPFGETSVLVADMKMQFVDYIGYMKQIFFGNDDFLYSFSKTFGGDMAGFAAYYLFNPFYLILLFFSNSELPAGIVLIIILMSGFSGLSFHFLLKEVYNERFASLIFSTAFALMGYFVAYVNCIHYFFSIMLLPLVILGLYRTYRNKRVSILYIVSVALCVCSNYYIGYMILIFTAVFFVCMVINDITSMSDLFDNIKTIWTVFYSTVLGVMISGFSILSVLYSLQGQKSSGLSLSLSRNFRLTEFFSGLYVNAFHGNVSDGLPVIYSGVIPTVFLLLYLMNKEIKIKEKILVAFMFIFMIAGFWIDAANVAWHGFAHPIGFPYRNSFLFSFLVLFFGYKGFLNFNKNFKTANANIIVILLAVYSAVLLLMKSKYVSYQQIAVTGFFVVIVLTMIVMLKSGRKYVVPAIVGIIVLQCGELVYNGYYSIDAYFTDKLDEGNLQETYSDYVEEQNEIIEAINSKDDGFFRIDKLYRRDHNDAMLIGYNGLSHFSSCETNQVKRFMGKLGFRDNGNWAFFSNGSTAFAESFMGMKYLISQYDETCMPYEDYMSINDKYIFKNPYALNLGFGMSESVSNVDMEETDLFIRQNSIAGAFTDADHDIYRKVEVDNVELKNIVKEENKYRKANSDEEAYIEYDLKIDSDDFVFMYFDAPKEQNTQIEIDGLAKEDYFTIYNWSIADAGYFDPGKDVKVKISLLQDEIEIDNAYFYYQNNEELKKWYEETLKDSCDIEKISSSHLIANVSVSDDTDKFVFTIPYEKDWTVKVDGKKVETEKVLDTLLAIDAPKGNHEIELRYIPRGLLYGSVVSIIGIISTFCVVFFEKKKKTTSPKI